MINIVHLVGPYDSTFVGPFHNLSQAVAFSKAFDDTAIDATIISADEFFKRVENVGSIEIFAPKAYTRIH